jgi:hypothetical protein
MGALKMKTKKTIMSGILSVVLFLTACSNTEVQQNRNERELQEEFFNSELSKIKSVTRLHSSHVLANEQGESIVMGFSELLKSEIIVIGEFIEVARCGFSQRNCEISGTPRKEFPWAFNKLLITEVLHGDIEVGEIITVAERYAFDEEHGSIITFDSDLTPMNKGDRWIFLIGLWGNLDEYFEALEHELGIEMVKNGPIYGNFGVYRYPVPTPEIAQSMERSSSGSLRRTDEIEISALGVFTRNEFDFEIYAQVIEHFQIEPQDWVNPGRAFDARLIEIAENR